MLQVCFVRVATEKPVKITKELGENIIIGAKELKMVMLDE